MRKTDTKKSENGKIKTNLKSLQEEKQNNKNTQIQEWNSSIYNLKHHAANCRELLQFRVSECLLAVHYAIRDM